MRQVTSASNEAFRALAELASSARERKRLGLSVIEGIHLVRAFFDRFGSDAGALARTRLFVPRRSESNPEISELSARRGCETLLLADELFAKVSQVEHGPGPIAIVPTPRPALPERLDADAIYLDHVQDPGNVGTVLRTAAAVGVRRVVASPGTAFCWSPKVLRAAMGAHFHLDLHEGVPADELIARAGRALPVGTAADAGVSVFEADLRAPVIWLFGSEGQGLGEALRRWERARFVSIPQSRAVESLNVGVAAAVCLYEQLRQRRTVSPGGAAAQGAPRAERRR